jgi:rfaE bifunctional protein kinase chain/domain
MENRRYHELLESFARRTVTVVGDFILDEYTIGDTKRVSREAPVIVVDYRESRFHPGGAANAVQNVASLGGKARACGVVGNDREGSVLAEILRDRGADVDSLIVSADAETAVKTRILAGELHAQKQQIARIDRSHKLGNGAPPLRDIAGRMDELAAASDAVIVSDYGLGVCGDPVRDRLLEACRQRSVPIVVDSRFRLMDFAGATTAVPNEVELAESAKRFESEGDALASAVVQELGLQGLVITRGSQGMRVVPAAGDPSDVGIVGSRDVADVTGAGDTVASAVALSLASGASLVEAAEMATYAAAVVVMKRGTATVDRAEMEALRAEYPAPEAP